MAKMFYTLEETAEKLNVSVDVVKSMAASGQLKEFRDRDKLIFKVEAVDLLGHKDDHSIPLADSGGGGSSLALSLEDSGGGSGVSLESPKEKSGVSIFDTEELESADPLAQTQVSATGAQELTTESVGSGSGLLDLTREGDDTSLGADLLQDVYSEKDEEGETQAASGLFENTPTASDVSHAAMASPALAMVAAEPFDGPGSGMAGGVAFATVAICAVALAATVLGIVGVLENPVVGLLPPNPMMWMGIFAGVLLLFGIVGWAMGRKA